MATATIVTIPDRYTARGLTWLGHGQQYSGSVPPGEYDVIGECDVCYSDLGIQKRGRAVQLVNIANAEKWYVSLNVADYLVSQHKRPI